ncbi:MAG: peptide chain release factor 1 [Candidatus Firestonebacteria bacterium]
MLEKLKGIEKEYEELTKALSDPALAADNQKYQIAMKRIARLSALMEKTAQYRKLTADIAGTEEVADGKDPELSQMAKEELKGLTAQKEKMDKELKLLLIPKDPNDEKNTIIEIRAGTGGDEAALFAASLFRMYSRYSEIKGWLVEVLSSSPTGLGGFKEIVFSIEGGDVYGHMRYESGVHRVQRVPATEASGRIHTSTVTVAVMPEAEEVDLDVKPNEIRIDLYCSSGAGGQSVNTTYSAVRLTHLPTGIVVACQDERSQLKNKAKAMKVLFAKLLDKKIAEQQSLLAKDRKSQIGTGERSEKIRTYNFPQNRMTDHRIGLTIYNLPSVMEGELDQVFNPLIEASQEEQLKHLEQAR